MYTVYRNFKLKKEKDYVKISADGFTELEKVEDEWLISPKFPKFLQEIVEKKLSLDKYDVYNIYTLNITNHNKVTDYKKIWQLAEFEKVGLYDNYYDGNNGRIYFGITKGFIWCKSSHLVGNVAIFIPKENSLATEGIFELFSANCFDINLYGKSEVLPNLQKLMQESIVVYQSINDTSLNIYGDSIEKIFDEMVLPSSEVIEK